MIAEACSVARTLQPSVVVVEDVDLIAEQREHGEGEHPLLFQLLNEMDGLGEDLDVTFLLTTNRADLLEPALAQRPGRVDHAALLPLPDAAARLRLLHLYQGSLVLDLSDPDAVIGRTEGVTASFMKELLRRAALRAADEPGQDGGRHADPGHRRAPDRRPRPAARYPQRAHPRAAWRAGGPGRRSGQVTAGQLRPPRRQGGLVRCASKAAVTSPGWETLARWEPPLITRRRDRPTAEAIRAPCQGGVAGSSAPAMTSVGGGDPPERGPQVHRGDRLAAARVALRVQARHRRHKPAHRRRVTLAEGGGEPAPYHRLGQRRHACRPRLRRPVGPEPGRRQVGGRAADRERVDPFRRMCRQPHPDHPAQRDAAVGGGRPRSRPAAAARPRPVRRSCKGRAAPGDPPWPRCSKRSSRNRSPSAAA